MSKNSMKIAPAESCLKMITKSYVDTKKNDMMMEMAPESKFSYTLNWVSGFGIFGYHLFNIAVHVVNSFPSSVVLPFPAATISPS